MRMRRKKNLEDRLLEYRDYMLTLRSEDPDFRHAVDHPNYLNLKELFGNDNPLHLEVGCGKGQFAVELAKQNPDINILAVEKFANVLVDACEKLKECGLKNLIFVRCAAEYLPSFLPENSVDRIYLNFSCPFPKKKYASHRLTAPHFLEVYDRLLKPGCEIHQKTDNTGLFEFSLNSFSDYGFTLKNISLDLHHSDFEGNIMTEYESRFVSMGLPIYRLEAYKK